MATIEFVSPQELQAKADEIKAQIPQAPNLSLIEARLKALEDAVKAMQQPPAPPPVVMKESGPITVLGNLLIENTIIRANGVPAITGTTGGLTLRNVVIEHTGAGHAVNLSGINDVEIDGIEMNKMDAPAKGMLGYESIGLYMNNCARAKVRNVKGKNFSTIVLQHKCDGGKFDFLILTDPRGPSPKNASTPVGAPTGGRGQCVQFDKCTNFSFTDFLCSSDPDNAWCEDLINVNAGSGGYFARGTIVGGNSPTGTAFMIQGQGGTTPLPASNMLVEDVDAINTVGGFALYNLIENCIYRRCRVMGPHSITYRNPKPLPSFYCGPGLKSGSFVACVASPNAEGTWVAAGVTGLVMDVKRENFTPRPRVSF